MTYCGSAPAEPQPSHGVALVRAAAAGCRPGVADRILAAYAENITFSSIFQAVRREQAERELRGKRNIGEIAFTLGFSSLGAFDRAFKRWHGMLPREYRAQDSDD